MVFRISIQAMVLVGALSLCIGCSTPSEVDPPVDLFAHGEYLCREARWGEARDVLREFLLDNPDHAGAHFYLGRSYLFWEEDFRPIIAEGELQTALALYRESGEHHIERFPDDYFELICDVESVKVCIRQVDLMQQLGFPRQALVPVLDRAWRYTESAQKTLPDHPDVTMSREVLVAYYSSLEVKPPNERGN